MTYAESKRQQRHEQFNQYNKKQKGDGLPETIMLVVLAVMLLGVFIGTISIVRSFFQ